jgi:hypothetical protein
MILNVVTVVWQPDKAEEALEVVKKLMKLENEKYGFEGKLLRALTSERLPKTISQVPFDSISAYEEKTKGLETDPEWQGLWKKLLKLMVPGSVGRDFYEVVQ